jgi:arylsulfatase A-like enzyme
LEPGAVSLTLSGGSLSCGKLSIGEYGVLDIAGGQLTITDSSARMAARLLIDQGKMVGYGGQGRITFGSSGTDLVLTAERTDALAQAPFPADLAVQVASGSALQLSWSAGAGAVSHDLYFSTDADAVLNRTSAAFQGNQSGLTFDAPVLSANTVYYWRVDEVTGSVTNQGDVWSFRTDDPGRNRPSIGVIRWDMYSGMAATQAQELGYLSGDYGFLAPEKWNWRAPFFCRYTNDVPWVDHVVNGAAGPLWFNSEEDFSLTRQATEQEIAFAGTAGAGLDYWIFGTAPASAGGNGWGTHWNLDAFLESERRLEINYAMMYRLDSVDDRDEFDLAVAELVWHAKQPNYQTVMAGRPIIYFISYKTLSQTLGDPADGSTVTNLAAAVQAVRDAFVAAGLPDPYLVASAVPAHARNESSWIDGAGFDAGNDYRGAYGGTATGTDFRDMPDNLEPYWDLNAANLSAALIPAAPCGADNSPRFEKGFGGEWYYNEPEAGDLTVLMNRVMDYIAANPAECEANTFTMYSWNEHSEGGFLCPLIGESPDYVPDTWRLDEVGSAVNSYAPPVETVLVFVRADGAVYRSGTSSFDPVFALDLTSGSNAVVSAAADDRYVYGLLDSGDVVRADLLGGYFPDVQTIGSFSGAVGTLTGLDVKGGTVYAVDDSGRVYRNFSTAALITLTGSSYVDFAAQSTIAFRGLYGNGGAYVWTRDQDNTYANFSNNGGAAAITSEAGSGYYALRDDGLVYGPDSQVYQGNFFSNSVDLTVVNSSDLYSVHAGGSVVRSLGGGGENIFGTLDPGASGFVAVDWLPVSVCDPLARVPNVIVILTDDHGFTDLGIHGIDAHVDTPAMDALAAGGALMTHGYATAPQCAPSRAGLLTGRCQNRFGLRTNSDVPMPLTETLNAERMRDSGYATGFVGKWHVSPAADYPCPDSDYEPSHRGFGDYWTGKHSPYTINYNLAGQSVPHQTFDDTRNRITVQGEAAEAFIGRHAAEPFYMHLAFFGPHIPRIETNDDYYVNFPELDYPNYSEELDDVRRQGLAMIKAIDDAVGGVMQKLRDLGIEEDTLILFAGDNGSNPKFWETIPGAETLDLWTGSENMPRRGEKGSLWEGGINVPMWAYWTGTVPAGQVIGEPVSTLDFAATAIRLASGGIPSGYDGVDLMPRLSGQTNQVARPGPLFWDWGEDGAGELAIRKGDWKMRRSGAGDYLFNLAADPNEQTNLVFQCLEKQAELEADLTAWEASLPPEGRAFLGDTPGDLAYIHGVASNSYPSAIVSPGAPADSDGDGMADADELAAGRNPNHAGDLCFQFTDPGDFRFYSEGSFDGWKPAAVTDPLTASGMLTGRAPAEGKIVHSTLAFRADEVPSLLVRMRSSLGTAFRLYWATADTNSFAVSRLFYSTYNSNLTETIVIPLAGHAAWDGQTVTQLRINPVNVSAGFEIDYICASDGNLDLDALTDAEEALAGTDPADAGSSFTLAPAAAGRVTWNGKAGRSYKVRHTPTLTPPDWNIATNIGVLYADRLIELSLPLSPTSGFYRVEVSYP